MTPAASDHRHWSFEPVPHSFIGFLIAPFAAGFAGALVFFLMSWSTGAAAGDFIFYLIMATYIGAVSLPWAFAAGWPIHALLLWRRKTHILIYGCAGAIIGVVAMLAQTFMNPFLGEIMSPFAPASIAFSGAGGFAGAAVFWLVRRPDRATAKVTEAA